MALTGRKRGWHLVDLLRLKADRSSDRTEGEAFCGIAFSIDLIISERGRFCSGCRAQDSVSIKITLSFHLALPPQNSFIIKLHANSLEEESPETRVTVEVVTKYVFHSLELRTQDFSFSGTRESLKIVKISVSSNFNGYFLQLFF